MLTVLAAVYGVIWMGLEGNLGRVVLMGTAFSLVVTGNLMQRFLGGRLFGKVGWLTVTGAAGLIAGFGSGLLTLFFMVLKTGLHGHGPEFRPADIDWVLGKLPLWSAAGIVAGLGVGLLFWGLSRDR